MPEADSEKDLVGFAARSCAVDAHPLIGRTLHLLEEVVENGFGELGRLGPLRGIVPAAQKRRAAEKECACIGCVGEG